MSYLIFTTQADAQTAADRIVADIGLLLNTHAPERVADGFGIIGQDAGTEKLQPTKQRTTAFAVPKEYVEGWGIPSPDTAKHRDFLKALGVPVSVVDAFDPLSNLVGYTAAEAVTKMEIDEV